MATSERNPDRVCALIEEHGVELLPTSPTFLNLLLLSEATRRHDLSSLKLITYGTEPMPQSTLDAIRRSVPWARVQQTYGLSELGILRRRAKTRIRSGYGLGRRLRNKDRRWHATDSGHVGP